MRVSFWLSNLCVSSVKKDSSRRQIRRRHSSAAYSGSPMMRETSMTLDPAIESLEVRAVPTAFALFIQSTGELNISMTSADNVSVGVNSATNRVQVIANGVLVGSLSSSITPDLIKTLIVTGSDSNNTLDLSGIDSRFTNLTSIQASGGDGNDTIIGSATLTSTLNGGNGADTITGGAAGDSLFGNDGNDRINGGDGNDTINGGNGADTVNAGLGNDSVLGGDGTDNLNGEDGNDTLLGNDGSDVLNGDANAGGAGNDSLDGGAGNDTLAGGFSGAPPVLQQLDEAARAEPMR